MNFSNIDKHDGLDFAQAHIVFAGATFTFEDTRMDYGEQRFVTIGLLDGVVVIVHTESTDEIRIISMRKATKNGHPLPVYTFWSKHPIFWESFPKKCKVLLG